MLEGIATWETALISGSSPYALDNIRIESLTASAGGVGPSGGVAVGGIMII